MYNKTPGYLRDILLPPTFLKMLFTKMKSFFFKILCSFFIFFKAFPTVNFFWSLPKKPHNKVERHCEKKTIWDPFRKILQHVAICFVQAICFESFCSKISLFFQKKTQNLTVLRTLTLTYSRFLGQVCYNLLKRKCHIQKRDRLSF